MEKGEMEERSGTSFFYNLTSDNVYAKVGYDKSVLDH